MKLEYQEYNINEVMSFFVEGFESKPGEIIVDWKTNYDPHTGKVIFKLYIEEMKKKTK